MIPIKTKLLQGETFNVGELIEALSDKAFDEEFAPVTIQTDDYSGEVCAIYECSYCNKVHILANNFHKDEGLIFNKEEIKEMMEDDDKVYALDVSLNKKDILLALKRIKKTCAISIETIADDECHPLAGVWKCSEGCSAIHLDTESAFVASVN